MQNKSVAPYFPADDIDNIIKDFRKILTENKVLSMGENVESFETEFANYVGSKFAIATNSCTTALETALLAIGLDEGDEVIVPPQTFVATASSVLRTGGKVNFVDTDENFLIDFEDLKRKISDKTKAVIIVHYLGLISDRIFEIRDYLNKLGIYLIEDCAHAHGASIKGIKGGNIGDVGCYSFFATKILTTGEGGMIVTNHNNLAKKMKSITNRGIDLEQKIERYVNIGSNYRMTEFIAILGRYQLKRLDEINKYRTWLATLYKRELKELVYSGSFKFQNYPEYINHAYWRFVIFFDAQSKRDLILRNLLESGIPADSRYSPLLHQQPLLLDMKLSVNVPNAEQLAKQFLTLPINMGLNEDNIKFITNKIKGLI